MFLSAQLTEWFLWWSHFSRKRPGLHRTTSTKSCQKQISLLSACAKLSLLESRNLLKDFSCIEGPIWKFSLTFVRPQIFCFLKCRFPYLFQANAHSTVRIFTKVNSVSLSCWSYTFAAMTVSYVSWRCLAKFNLRKILPHRGELALIPPWQKMSLIAWKRESAFPRQMDTPICLTIRTKVRDLPGSFLMSKHFGVQISHMFFHAFQFRKGSSLCFEKLSLLFP